MWMWPAFSQRPKSTRVHDMKESSLDAIRTAFKAELTRLQEIQKLPEEWHWEYRRDTGSTWNGQLVSKISFMDLLTRRDVDTSVSGIEVALQQDYPEYLQLVGTSISAGGLQAVGIPLRLASEAHKRFGTFALTSDQIQAILTDVSSFFDRSTVGLRLYAPALNLHGPRETPSMAFPGGIILQPMTDEECTQFYGGNPIFQTGKMPVGFPEFVLVKQIQIAKVIGSYETMKRDS